MSAVAETREAAFDAADLLNEDGSVTLRMTPSAWHVCNMSPDTYQLFNGDSWEASVIEHFCEQTERDLDWDSFDWTYDHAGIVRDLSEELRAWMTERLSDLGLECTTRLLDTWSPKEYNFVSDGFEIELTCDPAVLRRLTPDFDVDAWGRDHYSSYDGFHSWVTSRLNDPTWHAEYDGGFRIEALLAGGDPHGDREWVDRLYEAEWEIYDANTTVVENSFLETTHSLPEWERYARSLTEQERAGMSPLDYKECR